MKISRATQGIARVTLATSPQLELDIEAAPPADAIVTIWRETRSRRWHCDVGGPLSLTPRRHYIGHRDERLRILVHHVITAEQAVLRAS